MSANFNKVIIAGNLTRDPEFRYVGDGSAVVNFSIAINRRSQSGKEAVDYVDIAAWGKQAEACSKYLKKGSGVLVEGALRNRSYENKDGEKRHVMQVVAVGVKFLDKPTGAESQSAEGDDFEESPF